jgi:hypothetical protein
VKRLSRPLRRLAKHALFALQGPDRDAPLRIDAAELRGVSVRWPAVLQGPHENTWVEALFYGLRTRVPVLTVRDIPQNLLEGTVVIDFCRGARVHRVCVNCFDYPEVVYLGKDQRSSPPLALEFKMQFRNGGYGNDCILPGGFVSDSSLVDWFARGPRHERDRRRFEYDVYGRFGLSSSVGTGVRKVALGILQSQSRVRFYGGGSKVSFREFLAEIARSRVCIDLPGNGPFCFRLVNYMAVGACVISPPHAARLPAPLIDRKHIVYTRPDMSDLVDLCERYVNDDAAREAVVAASRDYYRRHLYWRSHADYYLRTMLDRLPA